MFKMFAPSRALSLFRIYTYIFFLSFQFALIFNSWVPHFKWKVTQNGTFQGFQFHKHRFPFVKVFSYLMRENYRILKIINVPMIQKQDIPLTFTVNEQHKIINLLVNIREKVLHVWWEALAKHFFFVYSKDSFTMHQ